MSIIAGFVYFMMAVLFLTVCVLFPDPEAKRQNAELEKLNRRLAKMQQPRRRKSTRRV